MAGPEVADSYVEAHPEQRARPLDAAVPNFHAALDGYAPGALRELPAIAAQLGLGRVWVKDESTRFGLPAYKALGAFYAARRALAERFGDSAAAAAAGCELVAPTDGNHGHAVARFAARLGLASHVFLPAGTTHARVRAIETEAGATAEVVDGSYLDAVARAVRFARRDSARVLVTDFDGGESGPTPAWVIDGYSTIFAELEQQLSQAAAAPLDTVVVQVGAAALACAAGRWCAAVPERPALLTVEPATAACLLESLRAGRIVRVPDPHRSQMAGLNCDSPSGLAFAELRGAVPGSVAIADEAAAWAMQALAGMGIATGESGAAGLAGLAVAMLDPAAEDLRAACRLTADAEVLVLVTERVTDPAAARRSLALPLPGWPAMNGARA